MNFWKFATKKNELKFPYVAEGGCMLFLCIFFPHFSGKYLNPRVHIERMYHSSGHPRIISLPGTFSPIMHTCQKRQIQTICPIRDIFIRTINAILKPQPPSGPYPYPYPSRPSCPPSRLKIPKAQTLLISSCHEEPPTKWKKRGDFGGWA